MRLLLDQNLSHKLLDALKGIFPGSAHVRGFGLERASDEEVWQFAKAQGFTIVSKDEDFHQRSFVLGHPPKVIWTRVGNCSTSDIENLLRTRSSDIARFDADPAASFLLLSK